MRRRRSKRRYKANLLFKRVKTRIIPRYVYTMHESRELENKIEAAKR